MFGSTAPVWAFLTSFGGAANPLSGIAATCVYETYPALVMIALDWLLKDSRASGRLPKYNPARRKTFSLHDWRHVCARALEEFRRRGLKPLDTWIDGAMRKTAPRKADQDQLDACLCLLVALHLIEQRLCLMVGDLQSGYIVVPHSRRVAEELQARCEKVGRQPSQWLTTFQLSPTSVS
jgi:predicted RNase H-like nuclease